MEELEDSSTNFSAGDCLYLYGLQEGLVVKYSTLSPGRHPTKE